MIGIIYKYNYNNNFGLTYTHQSADYNNLSNFELQNAIYRDLFNQDKDIIKIDNYNIYNNALEYKISEKGFLYIKLLNDIDYIRVNNDYIN